MGQSRAFLITAAGAERIANDICDFRYRAHLCSVPPGAQKPATANGAAETQILITAGALEMMVGGFATIVGIGAFTRVPAGAHFAWCNRRTDPAELLIHTASPGHFCRTLRLDAPAPLSPPDAPA